MPEAKPTPRIVPRVFCEDGAGYSRPAKCALCGRLILKATLVWCGLPSDPPGLRRPLHGACVLDYELRSQGDLFAAEEVTPAF